MLPLFAEPIWLSTVHTQARKLRIRMGASGFTATVPSEVKFPSHFSNWLMPSPAILLYLRLWNDFAASCYLDRGSDWFFKSGIYEGNTLSQNASLSSGCWMGVSVYKDIPRQLFVNVSLTIESELSVLSHKSYLGLHFGRFLKVRTDGYGSCRSMWHKKEVL